MTEKYVSKDDLFDKVDWEGGLAEAILGYGIDHDELPDGTPREIVDAWRRIEAVKVDVGVIEEWFSEGGTS